MFQPLPTRNLAYQPLWLAIGFALIAAVVALSLWPDAPMPRMGVSWSDKIGHFSAYFVIMTWFGLTYRRPAHLAIALRLFALGVLIEALQWLTESRYVEANDALANTAGIAAGWLLAATRFAHLLEWGERFLPERG